MLRHLKEANVPSCRLVRSIDAFVCSATPSIHRNVECTSERTSFILTVNERQKKRFKIEEKTIKRRTTLVLNRNLFLLFCRLFTIRMQYFVFTECVHMSSAHFFSVSSFILSIVCRSSVNSVHGGRSTVPVEHNKRKNYENEMLLHLCMCDGRNGIFVPSNRSPAIHFMRNVNLVFGQLHHCQCGQCQWP